MGMQISGHHVALSKWQILDEPCHRFFRYWKNVHRPFLGSWRLMLAKTEGKLRFRCSGGLSCGQNNDLITMDGGLWLQPCGRGKLEERVREVVTGIGGKNSDSSFLPTSPTTKPNGAEQVRILIMTSIKTMMLMIIICRLPFFYCNSLQRKQKSAGKIINPSPQNIPKKTYL